jgi:hypothetical protein
MEDVERFTSGALTQDPELSASQISEHEPLLGSARTRARSKRRSVGPHGNATTTQAILMVNFLCLILFKHLIILIIAPEILHRHGCAVFGESVSTRIAVS